MKGIRIFGITILTLLLFVTVSFGALVDIVPDNAAVMLNAKNVDSVVDFLSNDQLKSISGGEIDFDKVREEVKNDLGFDALDPEFIKGLFSNGVVISITGFTEEGIPEVLIGISPEKKVKFLNFIKAVEEKTGIKEELTSYKGINITRLPIPDAPEKAPKELAWAMLGNNIVIGIGVAPVKTAIEVFKGEKSPLSKSKDYLDVKDKIEEKLGNTPFFVYVATSKFSSLFEILKSKLPKDQLKAFESNMVMLSSMKPAGFASISTPEGIKIYGVTGIPDNYAELYKNITLPKLESLNFFPKNTFLYIGGAMPLSWEKIKELMPEVSRKQMEDVFAQLNKQIGVDIEGLILSWLNNEIAIGVFDPAGMIPKIGLLLGYTDQEKANLSMGTVLSMIAPALGAQPIEKEYEGIKYKSIENPMFPIGVGFINDRLVIANGIENIIDVTKENMAPFAKSSSIQEAINTEGLTALVYIDLQTVVSIIERFAGMGGGLDEETKKVFDTLKKTKDIIYWGGYNKGENYSFVWIKINNANANTQ